MKRIFAKFSSNCAETGRKIKKNEYCLYNPDTKQVFCSTSKKYSDFVEGRNTADLVEAQENAYFDNFCQSNNI